MIWKFIVTISVHRRHGVDGRQVLPAVLAVADAREKLPGRPDWHRLC